MGELVIVISRFVVEDHADFLDRARAAVAAFAACRGFKTGRVGRAADDPARWTVVTEWESVGAFRRALSSYDVKVYGAPLLAQSIEEPSAYEVLVATDPSGTTERPSARAADASAVGVGEAAMPRVPRDLPG